jgi:hypothetical protein
MLRMPLTIPRTRTLDSTAVAFCPSPASSTKHAAHHAGVYERLTTFFNGNAFERDTDCARQVRV